MTRRALAVCLVLSAAVANACSSSSFDSAMNGGAGNDSGEYAPSASPGSSGGSDGTGSGVGASPSDSAGAPSRGGGQGQGNVSAGLLTAGLWDDNANPTVFESYLSNAAQNPAVPFFDLDARVAARNAATAARPARTELDIAFLLDTTGSMGDELAYLNAEITNIATNLKTRFPAVTPRWSLVVYRDLQDDYVTRSFAFSSDVSVFKNSLAGQSANGGGDMPEAVQEGLEKLVALDWRTGDVARMAFWIADAPHHAEHTARVKAAIAAAQQKSLRIYPVAASGADALAEVTMRVAAQMTGGRYLFLTDDSGIGGSHTEPKVPCYHVTKLADALERSVAMELSGTFVSPEASAILRTVGQPSGATCITGQDASTQD